MTTLFLLMSVTAGADLDGPLFFLIRLLLAGDALDFERVGRGIHLDDQPVAGDADDGDRLEAGRLPGGRGVDALDLGVGVGAAEDRAVQHPLAVDVVAVFRPAGGLGGAIEPLDSRAEQPSLFGPPFCLAMAQPPFLQS